MISILKYNAGNAKSVYNAVNRLGYKALITDDIEILQNSDKVIFPGVGRASSAMKYLQNKGLDVLIKNLTQPVLGICLGQQLLCKSSEEGDIKCLGIFDSLVKKFPSKDIIPHMGWNVISSMKSDIFRDMRENVDVYFVHSYYCEISNDTSSISNYIIPFSASFQKNNFYGTQFHPEKSASIGEKILANFLNI